MADSWEIWSGIWSEVPFEGAIMAKSAV